MLLKLHTALANIIAVLTLVSFTYSILWQRKNGTSFILIHECCFYSKWPLWGECNWTQDICKFTCMLREGKWGLVLKIPWSGSLGEKAKERGVCSWITENVTFEKGEERVWLPYSSQHPRTCIWKWALLPSKWQRSVKEQPSLVQGRPGHNVHTAG